LQKPARLNCAKDNCTIEFEFQNKLATSLSGLTNCFADASKNEHLQQMRPGLVESQGAPATAPAASVASPLKNLKIHKHFPDSALRTWSERSTVTGSTERLHLLLFRHLTSFTIPILERVLDEMAGSEIVRGRRNVKTDAIAPEQSFAANANHK
jgi:hypothetical protein